MKTLGLIHISWNIITQISHTSPTTDRTHDSHCLCIASYQNNAIHLKIMFMQTRLAFVYIFVSMVSYGSVLGPHKHFHIDIFFNFAHLFLKINTFCVKFTFFFRKYYTICVYFTLFLYKISLSQLPCVFIRQVGFSKQR